MDDRQIVSRPALLPRAWRGLLLLGFLAAAVSCQAVPETPESPVPPPGSFSRTGEAELPDRWWTAFEDPALNELVADALEGNPGLKIAWDRLAQAEATARKTGAALSPTLDGTAGASGSERHLDGNRSETTNLSLGLAAGWEFDLFGRLGANRDAAVYEAAARAEDVRATAVTLSAEVASAWFQLVEQAGQIRLIEDQIRTNEQVLEIVTLRFRRGSTSAIDVLQQRQLVEARRGDLVTANAGAETTAVRLAVLLGRTPTSALPDPAEELVTVPPLPATGLPAELVGRRPDVKSAWDTVLASDERVAVAVADRYPRVSLSASLETDGDRLDDLFSNWFGALAANLVTPIIDGGLREAELERTRAVASAALNDYGRIVLSALGEVEEALVREQRQKELIASLEMQLDLARQSLRQIGESYGSGTVDYLRVLESLSTTQGLERSLLSARRGLLDYRIELCRALAGGFELTRPTSATEGMEVTFR
jgi:outer membrane protein, multidrug efflux system